MLQYKRLRSMLHNLSMVAEQWQENVVVIKKFMWQVYILKCADGTFYTGITTDIQRRVTEHNSSALGARYTSGRRPVKLVYAKKLKNRSAASGEENIIKKLSRENKFKLINKQI